MKEIEQQLAIAEFHGWKDVWLDGEDARGNPPSGISNPNVRLNYLVPDYANDLNAMHEAEKRLNVNQLSEYADQMDKICVPVHICPLTHWSAVTMATAIQRSEALLRTIGKWKDE